MENPLVQLPDAKEGGAIHILITKPGAIIGTEAQQEEIARSLPIPSSGKHWEYQPMSMQPLRFATTQDADAFLEALKNGQATDRFFVSPMMQDRFNPKKWYVNKAWQKATGELVVYVQRDNAPVAPFDKAATDAQEAAK